MQASGKTNSAVLQAPGRPRDPKVDKCVLDAAIGVYAAHGWAGFTFERIAREAKVGKGALYRRWPDRAALLNDTLAARWQPLEHVDSGSLASDLGLIVRHLFSQLIDHHAGAMLHMQFDHRRYPEVAAVLGNTRQHFVDGLKRVVAAAAARGEVSPEMDVRLIADIVVGTVTNRVLSTPQDRTASLREHVDSLADSLVTVIVEGKSGLSAPDRARVQGRRTGSRSQDG